MTLRDLMETGMLCLVGNWAIHWLYHWDYWYLFSKDDPIIPTYHQN